jgi:hypothetical protein
MKKLLLGASLFFFTVGPLQAKQVANLIVYSVSRGMPLSMKGLPFIKKIAREKKYKLLVINDPIFPVVDKKNRSLFQKAQYNEDFLNQGIFHHYPATLLFRNGKQCGEAIPGFKNKKTFRKILAELEKNCTRENVHPYAGLQKSKDYLASTLVRETKLPRSIAYYFRPINNDWLTYHDGSTTALYNRESGQEILFQGQYDSVPSPDAKYMTLPSPIRFFSMEKIFANPADAKKLPPLLQDPTMFDQYQSIGLLPHGRVRVMTSWNSGISARDYIETVNGLEAGFRKKALCNGQSIATPILSKNGEMLAGFDHGQNGTYTTQIYKIGDDGTDCLPLLDLGDRTGKIDFSFDNKRIAYVANTFDNQNLGAFVRDINSEKIWKLGEMTEKEALTFPSFLPNGNVILLRVRLENSQRKFFVEEYALEDPQ